MKLTLSSSFVPSTRTSLILLLLFAIFAAVSFAFLCTECTPRLQLRFESSATTRTLGLSSWSKIAEFDTASSSFRLIDTNDGDIESLSYNLVSPREWLEYCEARQRQSIRDVSQQQDDSSVDDDRYGGAYTVLRCDFSLQNQSWKIWGEDFHLQRLGESYQSLLCQAGMEVSNLNHSEEEGLALDASREAMSLLLKEAKATILTNFSEEQNENSVIVVMLTLLWDFDNSQSDNDESPIRIQGHAFSSMQASHLDTNPSTNDEMVTMPNPNASIQAVIGHLPASAMEAVAMDEKFRQFDLESLPNRYQNYPRAKLSSWCRRRRILEDLFKTKEGGDVILTKPCGDSVELLEGLTSNLFVVYPEKILRTASSEDVLGGYVRHLILDCAQKCGYTVEFGNICVEDAPLWQDVFVTSSIRLIIPVHKMLLPIAEGDDGQLLKMKTVWELASNDEETNLSTIKASDVLYTELLRHTTQ